MRRAALVAAAVILAAGPSTATATEVSSSGVAALASSAASDPAALAELRAVTSVDGVAVDVAVALDGASGTELGARLEELARSAEAAAPEGIADASEARARAAEVLANDELKPPEPSGGGGGVELPGVPLWLALGLALAIAVIAALVARSLGRASVIERELAATGTPEPGTRSRDLDSEADEAEGRGDFAAAVRLRFQAGLARLDAMEAIELRPSLTAAGAARESGSGTVGRLAQSYERVAFGGREAGVTDADEQRSGWGAAVKELRGR